MAGAGIAFAFTGAGHRVEQRETISHQLTALTVDAGSGDVTVRTGARPGTVEVTRKGPSSMAVGSAAHETWAGTTLAIAPDCPGACDVAYEIRVPDGVAVTAHTVSGDIELGGSLGAVSLESSSGDVDADLTASTLATHTGSGSIHVRLRSAPTQLSATAGSGDVDIRLPGGQAYAVDSQTSSGDNDVDVQQQSASDHRVQVQTGSGDIRLRDH